MTREDNDDRIAYVRDALDQLSELTQELSRDQGGHDARLESLERARERTAQLLTEDDRALVPRVAVLEKEIGRLAQYAENDNNRFRAIRTDIDALAARVDGMSRRNVLTPQSTEKTKQETSDLVRVEVERAQASGKRWTALEKVAISIPGVIAVIVQLIKEFTK